MCFVIHKNNLNSKKGKENKEKNSSDFLLFNFLINVAAVSSLADHCSAKKILFST